MSIAHELREITRELREIKEILREAFRRDRPAVAVRFKFEKEKHMALTLPLNTKNEKYFIIGSDDSTPPIKGAQLAPGQTIAVTSSDETIVALTADATPGTDAAGDLSVASGAVQPVAVGGPVTVTATVTNADGTQAEQITDTITVTKAVAGVATSIGELFEQGVSAAPPIA